MQERNTEETGPERLLTEAEIREARRKDAALQERLATAQDEMRRELSQPHKSVSPEELPAFLRERL